MNHNALAATIDPMTGGGANNTSLAVGTSKGSDRYYLRYYCLRNQKNTPHLNCYTPTKFGLKSRLANRLVGKSVFYKKPRGRFFCDCSDNFCGVAF